eukprot:CAMPEP_0115384628 /NCGR_PEP_ID=MMETSP0271-20121206/7208_1 /TAXON_ID=71861 /ORGANISM="Scrippsiella trochoidea, Strain CCMP3099" /LENGTH=102 /DNA_ID=CAMNT_0002807993 /DNA_START=243 /DNA_END=553 /DNA_ORIENTATION=-
MWACTLRNAPDSGCTPIASTDGIELPQIFHPNEPPAHVFEQSAFEVAPPLPEVEADMNEAVLTPDDMRKLQSSAMEELVGDDALPADGVGCGYADGGMEGAS